MIKIRVCVIVLLTLKIRVQKIKMEDHNKLPSENKLTLDENFWEERYKTNETGWDMKQVSPPLKSYIDKLANKNLKILIPGCGNAYEAEYLLNNGFNNVTLIDISSTLVNRLKQKFSDKPIQIIHQNFFDHQGKYDLILEQTFFCALDISFRRRYVEKCFDLLVEKGKIAGLLFDIDFGADHPPFGGNKEEYQKIFAPKFQINQLDSCKNSIPPRLGRELFFEFEKNNFVNRAG